VNQCVSVVESDIITGACFQKTLSVSCMCYSHVCIAGQSPILGNTPPSSHWYSRMSTLL
jgi:hypothetical protein